MSFTGQLDCFIFSIFQRLLNLPLEGTVGREIKRKQNKAASICFEVFSIFISASK